jgi:hypothetical protein
VLVAPSISASELSSILKREEMRPFAAWKAGYRFWNVRRFGYLQRVLEKIADLPITRIHELLPWNFATSQTDLGSSQVST